MQYAEVQAREGRTRERVVATMIVESTFMSSPIDVFRPAGVVVIAAVSIVAVEISIVAVVVSNVG